MKNIYYLIVFLILGSSHMVFAQFEGRKFLAGSAGFVFNNSNPQNAKATNNYGYNIELSLGKFNTDTRASGWRFNTLLTGQKQIFNVYTQNSFTQLERSGINGFEIGAGRFWQFYKHFNEHVGIYAGPAVDVIYGDKTNYFVGSDQPLSKNRTKTVMLSAGLNAGLYYKLSSKWWVTGSIAFSNPVNVTYTHIKQDQTDGRNNNIQKGVSYTFSPSFTFPSVAFGVRYFYSR